MVRNAWKEVENTDDDEDFEDTIWYYFQSSGKAYKSGKKAINGKSYIFDEDGKMLFGWIKKDDTTYSMADKDDDTTDWKECDYYAGDANDGAVVTSAWRQIRVHDESPQLKDDGDTDDYDYWFYFGSNGKKYKLSTSDDEDGKEYSEKTIKGVKYAFAEDGHMGSEWVTESATASTGVKYFSDPESGARVAKGWFQVVPSKAIDLEKSEDGDNTAKWFYSNSDGELAYGEVKSINGKKYAFNWRGELLSGLKYVTFDDTDDHGTTFVSLDDEDDLVLDEYTTLEDLLDESLITDDDDKTGVYYFAKPIDTDATMKTGTVNLTIDGDSYAFKFKSSGATKGKGINGREDSSYYVNGRKVKADSDNKYEIYECTIDENTGKVETLVGGDLTAYQFLKLADQSGDFAVISSAGTIVKSGTKKDGDDYKLVIKDYLLTAIKNTDGDVIWEAE